MELICNVTSSHHKFLDQQNLQRHFDYNVCIVFYFNKYWLINDTSNQFQTVKITNTSDKRVNITKGPVQLLPDILSRQIQKISDRLRGHHKETGRSQISEKYLTLSGQDEARDIEIVRNFEDDDLK